MSLFIANPDRKEGGKHFHLYARKALEQLCPCLRAAPGKTIFKPTRNRRSIKVECPANDCGQQCWHVAGCNLVRAIIQAERRVTVEFALYDQMHRPPKPGSRKSIGVSWKCTETPRDPKDLYEYDIDTCGDIDCHYPIARLAHELTHVLLFLQGMDYKDEYAVVQAENQVRAELGLPMRIAYDEKLVDPICKHVIPITAKDVTTLRKPNQVWWNAVSLKANQQLKWKRLQGDAEHCKGAVKPRAPRRRGGKRGKAAGPKRGKRLRRALPKAPSKYVPPDLPQLVDKFIKRRGKSPHRRAVLQYLKKAKGVTAWSLSERVGLRGPYCVTLICAAEDNVTVVTNVEAPDTPHGWSVRVCSRLREFTLPVKARAKKFVALLESLRAVGVGGTPDAPESPLHILTMQVNGKKRETMLYGYTYPGFNVVTWQEPEDQTDLKRWRAIVEVNGQWQRLLHAAEEQGIKGREVRDTPSRFRGVRGSKRR